MVGRFEVRRRSWTTRLLSGRARLREQYQEIMADRRSNGSVTVLFIDQIEACQIEQLAVYMVTAFGFIARSLLMYMKDPWFDVQMEIADTMHKIDMGKIKRYQ
jgi:hypothetical protein